MVSLSHLFISKTKLFINSRRSSRGQFLQPIGAKCKCAGTKSLAQSVSPTKLHPTLPARRSTSSSQLLLSTLFAIHQLDQCKYTGAKAAYKILVKLTPAAYVMNVFMCSFYTSRSQKRKKLLDLTVFFVLLGSACIKAAHKW